MRADLHLHTTASDGLYSPRELLALCREEALDCIAITDHDSLQGSLEASAAADQGMKLITGVELGLRDMPNLHLLAYGRLRGGALQARLSSLASARVRRAERIMDRLDSLGMRLDRASVYARAGGVIGRPHIADALVAQGYAADRAGAFRRWLAEGRPAYVEAERLTMAQALTLLRAEGFVPVLAHPLKLGLPCRLLRPLIQGWHVQGLAGVEVYHPSALTDGFEGLKRIAADFQLLVTGGSDFHGEAGTRGHGLPGCMLKYWRSVDEDAEKLIRQIEKG